MKTMYCVEHLFALAAVMHDTSTTWTTLVGKAERTNDFTASKFDEEDDILQIGQMLACLWERANRFLSRDTYIKLGNDGMERVSVFIFRLYLPSFLFLIDVGCCRCVRLHEA